MKIDGTSYIPSNHPEHKTTERTFIKDEEAMVKAASLGFNRMESRTSYHVVQQESDIDMQQTFNTFCGDIPKEGGQWLNRMAVQVC